MEDATALVADVMMLRAARGHDTTVPPDRIVWLVRGAVVMLGAFGAGTGAEMSASPARVSGTDPTEPGAG